MEKIIVNKKSGTEFEVTVDSHTTTVHHVTLSLPYYQKLSGGKVTPEILVEKSFEFLLEREPNTSILRSFDLPVIGRYFSEYERVIKTMI